MADHQLSEPERHLWVSDPGLDRKVGDVLRRSAEDRGHACFVEMTAVAEKVEVQERPEVLEWSRSRYADNEAITKAELDALAKTYLGSGRASRVIVIPQPGAAGGAPAGEAAP